MVGSDDQQRITKFLQKIGFPLQRFLFIVTYLVVCVLTQSNNEHTRLHLACKVFAPILKLRILMENTKLSGSDFLLKHVGSIAQEYYYFHVKRREDDNNISSRTPTFYLCAFKLWCKIIRKKELEEYNVCIPWGFISSKKWRYITWIWKTFVLFLTHII